MMTSLSPDGYPKVFQPLYKAYKDNISAFVKAAVTWDKVPLHRLPHSFTMKAEHHIPLPLPNTVLSFEKKLSSEQEVALQAMGCSALPGAKKDQSSVYRFPEGILDGEKIKALISHPNKVNLHQPTAFGQTNLAGVFSFLKLRGIITGFIWAHYYPAFTSEDTPSDILSNIPGFGELKRRAGGKDSNKGKKPRTDADTTDGEDMDVFEDAEEDDVEEFYVRGTPVTMARPPPEILNRWGPIANAPPLGGNVFPYFDGLLEADPNYTSEVVRNYFLLNLGDTTKECSLEFTRMKAAIGRMASSSLGKVLSHLMCGIKLALETQTIIYVYLERGHYTGFSLHGACYEINIHGRLIAPESKETLSSEIKEVDEHAFHLAKILQICARVIGKKTKDYPVIKKKGEITSARSLHKYLSSIPDFSSEEGRKEILDHSGYLNFRETPWKVTVETILNVVAILLEGSSLPDEAPMYIGGGNLFTQDSVIVAMSVFGEFGFSFRTSGGEKFRLPKDKKEDSMFKEVKGKKGKMIRPQRTFVVQKKSHAACSTDWSSFISDKVLIMKQQRSSAFKAEVFGGDKAQQLWEGLRDLVPEPKDTSGTSEELDEQDGEKEARPEEYAFDDFF